jgi:hypothetical protein
MGAQWNKCTRCGQHHERPFVIGLCKDCGKVAARATVPKLLEDPILRVLDAELNAYHQSYRGDA